MRDIADVDLILPIIARHRHEVGGLLAILQEIQDALGALPEAALRAVADNTRWSLVDIYGFASVGDCFTLSTSEPVISPAAAAPSLKGESRPVRCRRCNHLLGDGDHWLGGRPALRVDVAFCEEHGSYEFSSSPGEFEFQSEVGYPETGEVSFFCPHCNAELFPAQNCRKCGAPMAPIVLGVGVIRPICPIEGCGWSKRGSR